MQNGLNESFWDGLGVEIGPCADFDPKNAFWGTQSIESEKIFSAPRFFSGSEKNSRDRIFGEICAGLNIEVLSLPEGLVHSIGILEAPGVFLARRWRRC